MNTETIFVMEPLIVNGETITYSAPYPPLPDNNPGFESAMTGIYEILCAITVRDLFEHDPITKLGKTQQSIFDDFLNHYKSLAITNSGLRLVEGYLERFPNKRIQAYVNYERFMLIRSGTANRCAKTGKQKQSDKRAKKIAAKSKKKNRK